MTLTFQAPVPMLRVFDVQASLTFYRDVLCFQQTATSEGDHGEGGPPVWALLRSGDVTLMLRSAYDEGRRPMVPDSDRVVWHGDLVLYLLCPDLEELCIRLRQFGVTTIQGLEPFPDMDQVLITDPDGFVLCFHRRVGETPFV